MTLMGGQSEIRDEKNCALAGDVVQFSAISIADGPDDLVPSSLLMV
jgi:hypothetical protein